MVGDGEGGGRGGSRMALACGVVSALRCPRALNTAHAAVSVVQQPGYNLEELGANTLLGLFGAAGGPAEVSVRTALGPVP